MIEIILQNFLGIIITTLILGTILFVVSKIMKFKDTSFNTAVKTMLFTYLIVFVVTIPLLFVQVGAIISGLINTVAFAILLFGFTKKMYSIPSIKAIIVSLIFTILNVLTLFLV